MKKNFLYLTKEKIKELKAELENLIKVKRDEIADKLDWYRNNVEDEEDPAYSEVLEQKTLLETRIQEIEDMLSKAKTITKSKTGDKIDIGSNVKVKYGNKTIKFQIVSEVEADPKHGKISDASPLGKRLIGQRAKDQIEVQTPGGKICYTIVSVK